MLWGRALDIEAQCRLLWLRMTRLFVLDDQQNKAPEAAQADGLGPTIARVKIPKYMDHCWSLKALMFELRTFSAGVAKSATRERFEALADSTSRRSQVPRRYLIGDVKRLPYLCNPSAPQSTSFHRRRWKGSRRVFARDLAAGRRDALVPEYATQLRQVACGESQDAGDPTSNLGHHTVCT